MIDTAAARQALATIITAAMPDLAVNATGFDAVASFPAVVIGMPDWQVDNTLPYGIDKSTVPVAVVVARGSQDSATIGQLDELWHQLLDVLRTASEHDPSLGGVCAQSIVTRAGFGQFNVQGQMYPAQTIFIDLFG